MLRRKDNGERAGRTKQRKRCEKIILGVKGASCVTGGKNLDVRNEQVPQLNCFSTQGLQWWDQQRKYLLVFQDHRALDEGPGKSERVKHEPLGSVKIATALIRVIVSRKEAE